MSAQLSAATFDANRVLPVVGVGVAASATDSRLRYSARTSDQFDDMQRCHNGQHGAVVDAPSGTASAQREADTVGRHEWRWHRVRHGDSGSGSGIHHDVSERRFHKNKWREVFDGDGGVQVSGTVALSSYIIRAADVRGPTKQMDVSGQPDLVSVRNRSAKVVADDKSPTDLWMVLRRTLMAGFGRDTDVNVSWHVSSARLVGPEVPVLVECANGTRADQCPVTLRER